MRQRCDVFVPKDREAVFVHSVPVRLLGMLVSLLGVFKNAPGRLLNTPNMLTSIPSRRTGTL